MGGKEEQTFMGSLTASKILRVDKVLKESPGFILRFVTLTTSLESVKGQSKPLRRPDIHQLYSFRAWQQKPQ